MFGLFEQLETDYTGAFVLQKHNASTEHYDLRLEVPTPKSESILKEYQLKRSPNSPEPDIVNSALTDSVLASFALPGAKLPKKGDQVLAVETEPHPVSYLTFEGTIPPGNYGAGEMTIEDSGEYRVREVAPDKLSLTFFGKKLVGDYSLINVEDRNWLLVRKKEHSASTKYTSLTRDNKTAVFDGEMISILEGDRKVDEIDLEDLDPITRKQLKDGTIPDRYNALGYILKKYPASKRSSLFPIFIRKYARILKTANVLDYVHPGLDLNVWDLQGNVRRRHQKLILNTIADFLEREQLYKYPRWIKFVLLVGSLTSYQYHTHSAADVVVLVDTEELQKSEALRESVPDLLKTLTKKINRTYVQLKKTKHPLKVYFVEDSENPPLGDAGAYDVVARRWLRPPKVVDPDFDPEIVYGEVLKVIENTAQEFDVVLGGLRRKVINAQLLDDALKSFQPALRAKLRIKLDRKLEEIEEDIELLLRRFKKYEEESRGTDLDSVESLRVKFLQRFGYVDVIRRLAEKMEVSNRISPEDLLSIEDILTFGEGEA